MNTQDWNPGLYLKFSKERTQPSIDLVSRINLANPHAIIDIGCGPGNSTQILTQRWPDAEITGIDNSPAMIEHAKKDFPHQKWKLLDAGKDQLPGRYDIVFSNAAIQWIPNHADLIKKLSGILTDRGILAVQVPLFWDMPFGKELASTAMEDRWHAATRGVKELLTGHDCSFYYDQLSPLFSSVEMWESSYMHILDSHASIVDMMRSTGLKPYLDRLANDADRNSFEGDVLKKIASFYPLQKNGKVIYPFKRLFFIAGKSHTTTLQRGTQ